MTELTVDPMGEPTARRHARLTGQEIGTPFVARYILAFVGMWVATLTPASVTLAIRVGQLDPEGKIQTLAWVASAGAAAAVISNPIFGVLSDSSTLRWGQRRPFILGGLLVGMLAVIAMGFAPSAPWLAAGWAATQLAANAIAAPLYAILPERVPASLRGKVAGFMGMTPQLGIFGGAFLIDLVGTDGAALFVVPAIVGVALALPFALTLREARKTIEQVNRISLARIAQAFWINPLVHRDFARAWVARFFVWTAYYMLVNYKTYFLIDRLGFDTNTVASVLSTAMFILALCIIFSSIAGGWISDWAGQQRIFIIGASFLFIITMIYMALADTLFEFYVGIGLSGLSYGLYLGVDYALVARLLPDSEKEAAKGMGVFNLSSTIPQTMAPVLAPVFLLINAAPGTSNYASLFLAGAILSFLGAIVAYSIRTR